MKARVSLMLQQLLMSLLFVSVAFAQPPPASAQVNDSQPTYTQAELDQMLAPIALYPDSLLSQILMASTYPMEVVLAARWTRANPGLSGEQAVRAVEQYEWDPSVMSLAAFPQILDMMDQKLEWTQRLGDAFLAQQQQVMGTVQELRAKAQAAGNLQSNEYVRVVPRERVIIVEQVNPRVVYVPYYDPWRVYGSWWWPAYPPVYWRPWPGYYAAPGVSLSFWWGSGISVGAGFFFGTFDWPHRHVTVVNVHNFYYRPRARVAGVPPGHWIHEPVHRRGVPYRDARVREQFRHEYGSPDARREYRGDENLRRPIPQRRDVRREERDIRERERVRSEARESLRPESRERLRPEPRDDRRTVPRSSNQRDSIQRELRDAIRRAAPEVRREVPRAQQVPRGRPDAIRRAVPEVRREVPRAQQVPRVQSRDVPSRPQVRSVPRRPRVEAQPNVFEGVGQGRATRDNSERGRASTGRAVPRSGVERQRTAPETRPRGNVSPRERPSDSGRNESRRRQQ